MTRKSLRPHLNQIRSWVRQGRTDAWIAHQLEVTVQQIGAFRRENELSDDDGPAPDELDLRAEDDAAIAAELEAEAARKAQEEAAAAAKAAEEAAAREAAGEDADDQDDADADAEAKPAAKRRGRRGGRGRSRKRGLEGTFDHGEEGYGLWLDPDVQDDPVYAEHWAGHRPVTVTIEEDQIVIKRAGGDEDPDE